MVEISLGREAIWALNHLMGSLTPKGTSELREKNHINRALHAGPLERTVERTDRGEGERAISHPDRPLVVTKEDALKYCIKKIEKAIEDGVPGQLTLGYEDLLDAMEAGLKTWQDRTASLQPKKE